MLDLYGERLILRIKKMSFDELQEATKLNDIDLAAAIGWLAREDKISIRENDGEFYISNYQETYF